MEEVRCMMAEGRCVISLFHSHLVSCICAQVLSLKMFDVLWMMDDVYKMDDV